ncbi:MAG: EscU/YscU/HrcU family type III secretion system export apparatus switch protein [Pseudomonadota bacterium]
MAEAQDGQEKTEEPTEKRRADARKDGQVVTSTEVFVLVTLATATLIYLVGRAQLPGLAGLWAQGFVISPGTALDGLLIARTGYLLAWTAAAAAIGLPLIAVILAAQAGVGGLNFATKAIGFKPEKIDPLKGFQRMFSMRALVELSKATLKVLLLLGAGLIAVWPLYPAFETAASQSTGDAIALLGTAMLRLLGGVLVGLLLIAAIDLVWQIHQNTQQLRMSRQEIKDEVKEAEGAPEQKAEQRRRQRDASRRAAERKALDDVPSANAIITNPTHFAVALRYDPASGKAPIIVAMGKGDLARELIRRGRLATVKTLRVPPLSRALFFHGTLGKEIPEALYAAVAVVLAHVWRLDRGMAGPLPAVSLPEELLFDEFGRPASRPSRSSR